MSVERNSRVNVFLNMDQLQMQADQADAKVKKLTASLDKMKAAGEQNTLAFKQTSDALDKAKAKYDLLEGQISGKYSVSIRKAEAETNKLKKAIMDMPANHPERQKMIEQFGNMSTELAAMKNEAGMAGESLKGATEKGSKGFSGLWGLIRQAANIIPGLGISGMFLAVGTGILWAADAMGIFSTKLTDAELRTKAFADAAKDFEKVNTELLTMQNYVELAKKGLISKNEVLAKYNDSLGKTMGVAKSFNQVEDYMADKKRTEAYLQMMLLKAAANLSLEQASQKAFAAEEARRKKLSDFESVTDIFGSLAGYGGSTGEINQQRVDEQKKKTLAAQQKRKDEEIKINKDAAAQLIDIAKKFNEDAGNIAKQNKFDLIGGNADEEIAKKQLDALNEKLKKDKEAQLKFKKDLEEKKLKFEHDADKQGMKAHEDAVKEKEQADMDLFQKLSDAERDQANEEYRISKIRIKLAHDEAEEKKRIAKEEADYKKKIQEQEIEAARALADLGQALNARQLQQDRIANNKELKELERKHNLQKISDEDYAAEKEKLNREMEMKSAESARRGAMLSKAMSLFEIGVKTAEGVMQINANPAVNADISQVLRTTLTGLIIGTGAAQAAAVLAQPLPELPAYATGTEFVNGPGTATSDSVLARLSVGERVVPANINAKLGGLRNEDLPKLNASAALSSLKMAGGDSFFSSGKADAFFNGQESSLSMLAAIHQELKKPNRSYVVYSDIQDKQQSINKVKNLSGAK